LPIFLPSEASHDLGRSPVVMRFLVSRPDIILAPGPQE
jgi:hypothetical protein